MSEVLINPNEPQVDSNKPRTSQATRLLEIAENVTLFHDADEVTYATLQLEAHSEHWPIRSRSFRTWLAREFYAQEKHAPSTQSLQDALSTLQGIALFEGKQHTVALRVGEHDNNVYLDLCDEQWRTIKITADGWEVIEDSPVRFVRRRGMLALPTPIPAGPLDRIWEFLNVNDEDRKLVVGWLLGAFHPHGPYPILIFQGEQG